MGLLYLEYLSEIPLDLNLKNDLRWNSKACPWGSSIHQHRRRAQWSCGERRPAECHDVSRFDHALGIAGLELIGWRSDFLRWVPENVQKQIRNTVQFNPHFTHKSWNRWIEFSCGWRAWVCSEVLERGSAICSLSSLGFVTLLSCVPSIAFLVPSSLVQLASRHHSTIDWR